MDTGIVYLLGHPQLAARLVVSLHSLRKWTTAPVTVFTTHPDSHAIGEEIARDCRLMASHQTTTEVSAKTAHKASYLTKSVFLRESPYRHTVFIDADTLVVGPVDELIECAQKSPLTITIYGRSNTHDRVTNEPLRVWEPLLANHPEWSSLLKRALNYSFSTVNAGVFAVDRDSDILKEWRELTSIGRETPLPEETALQLIAQRYPYQMLGAHFNCLPQLHPEMSDVRIWHFAGATHIRHEQCRDLWLPAYEESCQANVARISEWSSVSVNDGMEHTEAFRPLRNHVLTT